ncbi:hypothetical protein C1H46_029100 [Malus baccata]|uniref:Uncharacterized protein n=1 Tax=Malus baccata TaxID=106549 RepID=A0A540LFW0_MALBA|nr:hypothetical protein C1H46_029100 [Malus baccata]
MKRSSSHDDLRAFKFKMEKVTILRRGDSLDSKMNERVVWLGPGLRGSGPGRKWCRRSTCMPEPSSLLLPSFSRKKQVLKVVDDDSATRDDVPVCLFGSLLISTSLDLESFFGFWFSVIDVLSGE